MPRRLPRRLPLLVILSLLAGAGFLGCSTTDEAEFLNPLDPRNPESVDPFGLVAFYDDGKVTLDWTVPAGPAIAQVVIEGIINSQPTDLDTVDVDVTTYVVSEPRGNTDNLYRLRALDANGFAAQTSHMVAATVFVPPWIDIALATDDPAGGVKISRAVHDIVVRAVAGDLVQIDTLRDFSTTSALDLADGQAVYEQFQLRKLRREGIALPDRQLYVRAGLLLSGGGDPLWSSVDSLRVSMALITGINKAGGGATVARPFVNLNLTSGGAGVDSVRFATSEEGLAAAPWLPPAASYLDVPLDDTAAPQSIIAQFASSFGDVVQSAPLPLRGDPLTTVSLNPQLPSSGLVEGQLLRLTPRAVATEMRLSTDPGFADAPWRAYADTVDLAMPHQGGDQTIYGQFRNHWFLSGIISETVTVSGAVLDVAFTAPLDGDPVSGGNTAYLSGQAGPLPDRFAFTALDIHLGDGWQSMPPDTTWEATWEVPRFEVDTPRRLGIRAIAEHDSTGESIEGVQWIEVTVSQLTVSITEPTEGAELTTGGLITLRGRATRDLTSAPLDSVVVTIADTSLTLREGLGGWTARWDAPAVTEATPTTVTATAHAGEDSVTTSVGAILVPPEPEEDEAR